MTDWLDELPRWGRELLETSRVARLGLLDDRGRPRVLPVTFALHEGQIWSAIDKKPKRSGHEPARVGFLRRHPQVALTVDHYADEWQQLAWVQLLGQASIHGAAEQPAVIDTLAARYEQYRTESPPGPLIAIEVERSLHWRAAARN